MTRTQEQKLDRIFDELGFMLGCSGTCEEGCAFRATSIGVCPLGQFRDRVEEALEAL